MSKRVKITNDGKTFQHVSEKAFEQIFAPNGYKLAEGKVDHEAVEVPKTAKADAITKDVEDAPKAKKSIADRVKESNVESKTNDPVADPDTGKKKTGSK